MFDYRSDVCRAIMIPWVQCAYTRKCMALIGVEKSIHLPEQGALSIIMLNYNVTTFFDPPLWPRYSHASNYDSPVLNSIMDDYNGVGHWNYTNVTIAAC